jgi:RimK family alpha-L-glutamate ligase
MKRVLIIINGYGLAGGIQHQVERLKEEFSKRGVEVDVVKNTQVFAYIFEGNVDISLPKYDFVLYLDKDRYVAELLEKAGYKLYNSIDAISKCDDKMLTHICLANEGIKMPTSISSTLCYTDNGNRDYLYAVIDKIGLPMIVKENYGSLGKQVYLANNHAELLEIENRLIHIPHIFQEFIESSKGKDYRVIVIGGKVVAYMKRENPYSYLSNLATGGTASKVELPKLYLDIAERCSKILNLDYCGVDILEGPHGEPIVSEVNSNAFYEGIEKTTGINVAGCYVDYLLSKN